jgi:adenylate kinase
MRIVLFGKPGSGKGTQAQRLSEELGLPHLSSGAILRDEIRERTGLGLRIERHVLRGEIGPEDLIVAAVIGRIRSLPRGDRYILDGFPRTLLQAEQLDAAFPPDRCVLLDIPDAKASDRITGRLTCLRCGAIYHAATRPPRKAGACDRCAEPLETRADDTADAVRRRLEVFSEEVAPVLDRYESAGRLIRIDADRGPDAVAAALKAALWG